MAECLEADPLLAQGTGTPPLERLAYHYAQGDVAGRAALYLERAGDYARDHFANTAAEEAYRAAVTYLERLGRGLDVARAQEKRGTVLRMMGLHKEALAALERAVEGYQAAGDGESMAGALAETWLLHVENGTVEEGLWRYQGAIRLLEHNGGFSRGLGLLYSAQANLLNYVGRRQELLHAATRAVEIASREGDLEMLGEAQLKRCLALQNMVGRVDEALHAVQEAVRFGEAAGGPANLAGWYRVMAGIHYERGELEECRKASRRSREVAERQGNLLRLAMARHTEGHLALWTGAWEQAEDDFRGALAEARRLGASRLEADTILSLGHLFLQRGEIALAREYIEQTLQMVSQATNQAVQRQATCRLAECDVREGKPQTASARLLPLLDQPGTREVDVNNLLVCLAWARLEQDRADEAARLVAEAIERLRTDGLRMGLVEALRVSALVSARQHHWEEVDRTVQEGLALVQTLSGRYAEGRFRHIAARVYEMRQAQDKQQNVMSFDK